MIKGGTKVTRSAYELRLRAKKMHGKGYWKARSTGSLIRELKKRPGVDHLYFDPYEPCVVVTENGQYAYEGVCLLFMICD
jgi:hypothetical protein